MILLEVDLAEDGRFPRKTFIELFGLLKSVKAVRIKGVYIVSFYVEACKAFEGQYLQIEEKNTTNYILYNRRHNQIVNANYYGKLSKMVILPTTTKVTLKISTSIETEEIVNEIIKFKWPDHITQLTFATTNSQFIDEMFEALITLAKTLLNDGKLNQINLVSKQTSFILRESANSIEAEVAITFKLDTWTTFIDEYYYEKLSSISVVFKAFEVRINASSSKRANIMFGEYDWPYFYTRLIFVANDKDFDAIEYEHFIKRATKLLTSGGKYIEVGLSMEVASVFVRKLDKSIEIDVKLSSEQIILPYQDNYYQQLVGSSVVIGAFKVEIMVPGDKLAIEVAKIYACPSYVTHLAFKAPNEHFDAITIMWIVSIAVDRFNYGNLKNIEILSQQASVNIPKLDNLFWIEVTFLRGFFELPDLERYYYYRVILSEKFSKAIEACNKLKDVKGLRSIDFRGERQFQKFMNNVHLLPIPEQLITPRIITMKKPYIDLEMMSGPKCVTCITAMEFIGNNFVNFRRLYIKTTQTMYRENMINQESFYHLENIKIVNEFVCNASADFNHRTGYCFFFWNKGYLQ